VPNRNMSGAGNDKSDGKRWGQWAWMVAFVPILFAAYMGAYYALASPDYAIAYMPAPIYSTHGSIKPLVRYRFGGPVAEKIFALAHDFDRRVIRPDKWRDPPHPAR
jgi:hypothetical protein